MSKFDPITLCQDNGLQTRWPCGNDTACLVTTSPDLPGQSDHFAHHRLSAPFALSGSLRVQWASTTQARRRFPLNA